MIPDDVCEEYANNTLIKKLTIQTFKEEQANIVLIEGEAEALEFLGNILLTQSRFEKNCSFSIGPNQAGYRFFTENSTHGIFIHRLPCTEKPGKVMAKPNRDREEG
jgi:hypothetical protein